MSLPLLAAIYALAAAVTWGTGDLTSGTAARRIGAFHTLLISFVFGLTALLITVVLLSEPFPPISDMVWGAIAGLFGTAGFLSMLQGFVVGRMGVVAPVSAVLGAGIPVVIAAFSLGLPSQLQLLGFLVAFVSIWLLSRKDERSSRPSGFGFAVLAGLGFGLFFSGLDQIQIGVYWPLVASRVVATLTLALFALATRRPLLPAKLPISLLVLAGVLDVLGNLLFLLATQTGRLDVASVLVSLYPAVTVLLAALIAKEHLNRLQIVGVALAVLATALITL